MAISSLDWKFYYPVVTGYEDTAGGKMSNNSFDPSLLGVVIQPLTVEQALTGGDFYTKFYASMENSDNTPLAYTYAFLKGYDSNTDSFLYRIGTFEDVISDAKTYTDWKCGGVVSSLYAGDTTVSVALETTDIFLEDTVYLFVTDGVNSEVLEIDNTANADIVSGVPQTNPIILNISSNYNNGNGAIYTYSITSQITCGFALSAGNDGILQATVSTPTTVGTVVIAADSIEVYNNGTLYESFVLEMTGATTFKIRDGVDATKYYASDGTITDSTNAYVWDNNISATTLPNPYRAGNSRFYIPQGSITSGTAGDTISFSTTPAAIPFWIKRVVPAGTPSAVEQIEFMVIGQGL